MSWFKRRPHKKEPEKKHPHHWSPITKKLWDETKEKLKSPPKKDGESNESK